MEFTEEEKTLIWTALLAYDSKVDDNQVELLDKLVEQFIDA